MCQNIVGDEFSEPSTSFACVSFFERSAFGIVSSGVGGGLTEGPFEVWIPLFAPWSSRGFIHRTGNGWDESGVGSEVPVGFEPTNVSDLIVNGHAQDVVDAWG